VATINERLMHTVNETNRCFYLHLGVGLGIHPFALQALFRLGAADVLSRPDEEKCQLFGMCLFFYHESSAFYGPFL
jgi:hypothetical protein